MKHKEGCDFKNKWFSVHSENLSGDEERLEVDENGIVWSNSSGWSGKGVSEYIFFNFCPVCGADYNEE